MSVKHCALVLVLTLGSNAVFAACMYNGKEYPEGSVIGHYVCVDGKWVK